MASFLGYFDVQHQNFMLYVKFDWVLPMTNKHPLPTKSQSSQLKNGPSLAREDKEEVADNRQELEFTSLESCEQSNFCSILGIWDNETEKWIADIAKEEESVEFLPSWSSTLTRVNRLIVNSMKGQVKYQSLCI